MPHIFTSNFKFNKNKTFNFIASSPEADLIGVRLENEEFLLLSKEKNSKRLIKYDKITRGANLSLIKRALGNFATDMELEILSSNIDETTQKDINYLKDIRFFIESFKPTTKKIYIEIGFGTGRHILHRAKLEPDALFIGVEIYKPSIETLNKHLLLENISNILMLNYDARLFLEILHSNSIDTIFVHFPVPWDKKPHRRVFSKEFIDEAIRVLKVDGTLELRTDSPNYFDYSLGLFLNRKVIDFEVNKNRDIAITSKYEDRWRRAEKDIFDLILKNKELSKPLELTKGFEFDIEVNFEKISSLFEEKTEVNKEYILHFEKIFKIDSNSGLIRLTLGSPNRPEQKYIYIEQNRVRYFKDNPIPSKSNLLAHKKIVDWLVDGK